MKKALAYAYRTAQEEGRNPEELGLATVKDRTTSILDANVTVPEVEMVANPTWQTLDYVKRGAWTMWLKATKIRSPGSSISTPKAECREQHARLYQGVRRANPDYAAARALMRPG
jgi:hypothetical protein